MRKPFVSPMMLWMATVTIQSLLTAILLGPLFAPISLTVALKLNGTTTTAATPSANYVGESQTTIASFLQPDISETTLSPQLAGYQVADELTTTQSNISPSQSVSSSSPLTKRHSSILVGESSSQDSDSPRFITKASSSPSSTENDAGSKEKPQRNGTGVSTTNTASTAKEDGERSSSSSTAEPIGNDDVVPSTTGKDSDSNESGAGDEEGASANNSLGNNDDDDADSTSLDKDESDTYFSANDDDNNASEGDGATTVHGESGGDTIFPPEEERDGLDTDESIGATTFASLLRPAPTTNPQTFSFSSQLANKLSRSGGSRVSQGNSRLGTRGLSAKSELNAITSSTTTISPIANIKNSTTDSSTSDNDSSGSIASEIVVGKENHDNSSTSTDISDSTSNINSNISSGNSFDLNGGSFQSRSNANLHQEQSQQLPRARPTSTVINNYNSNSNHNNNLHNRIIKRKKLPFGRGNSTTAGSSLSSIYGNSILTSTPSSGSGGGGSDGEVVEVSTTQLPPSSGIADPSFISTSTAGVSVTTETNSLLNASHDDDDNRRGNVAESEQQKQQSSPASTSGAGSVESSSHTNLTTPLTPLDYNNTSSATDNNNGSASLSSSRAILGFGTSSASSNYGKVKRPKPIIIRDHDDSVYINNLPENSANTTTENVASSGSTDETATIPGAGEDESNKPVGNNALPTPPYKRRVKLTSRRVLSTPTPRPTEDFTISPTTPSFVIPSSSTTFPVTSGDSDVINSSSINSLMAQAASGATDYRHGHNAIRPSITHEAYNDSPYYSSRRVYKEEFGITRNSYGNDNGDGDDGELQATTEYFSLENPTPYPIPMGVRSAPLPEESAEDNEELTGKNPGKNRSSNERNGSVVVGGGNQENNRYRDYYSEVRSPSVQYGSGGGGGASGNLHIKSDSHYDISSSVSPFTVTVTQTVVQTTPHIVASAEIGLSSQNNDTSDEGDAHVNEDDKGAHPNLLPTPALPSSAFVNPTTTQSSLEIGQGPAIVSHSVEDVRTSTSQVGIQSSHFETNNNHDNDDKGNDQDQQSHHHGKQGSNEDDTQQKSESTPVVPQQIQPTPVISSKNIKSVYFTQVEHPHFTSSSYEFTTSSMYSYSFPDHDSMHSYYPDMMNHDDHLHHHDDHHEHPYPQPASKDSQSSEPEHANSPEVGSTTNKDDNGQESGTHRTTVSDGKYFTSSTPPQFWDDLSNLTKSSSSQVPIKIDDESGAMATPTIDIDIYPPVGAGPSSKPDDASAYTTIAAPVAPSPTTTGRPTTNNGSQIPGSLEENDISEEEQKKQSNTTVQIITTSKPSEVTSNNKDGSDEDNETKSSSGEDGKQNPVINKGNNSSGIKTPYGVGDSFGIGKVHVPVMVQVLLDVAQPVFCSHLSNFKKMIVTVYESQKRGTKVDPEQIVVYTNPGCDPIKSDDSTIVESTTKRPSAPPTGKVITTPKGTFPLTSPPTSRSSGRQDEEGKKSRSGKDISLKNATSSSESSDLNKANTDNKSEDIVNSDEKESAHLNKSSADAGLIRSRRSTKMATSGAAAKNTNMSESIKEGITNSTSSTENLLSVYFYVNDKNGSYDRDLTSSFVKLWNDSSRLTNVSDSNNNNGNGGGGETVGGNDGSNGSAELFIKRVKKVGMVTASQLAAEEQSPDENSGIIVAITVASIVAVCLFVLGVGLLIMRHRQSQTKFAKRCTPVTLDDYSLDNISVYNSFRRKQRLRGSKRSYTNAAFEDSNAPSRSVNASQLAATVSDVAALENEFRAIPNITATLDDIPSGAETKNRYANVIPMPDTRVLLTFLDDIPNSDYMNANYVRGVNGEPKRYIVTQGPLEDTIVDFWRMVWEQQIRVIFMLTDFAEGGIAKCAEYYPRSETIDCSQLHGDFQITLEKRDITDNCITSYLVLKDMERNLRRDVVHFWYHSWPEKGVPASPKMTIDFLNRSKKFTKEPTPVLVHCSPGTGRSGTVVACDIAMKEYDTQNKVDVPRIVMKVRQDRAGAVQTKEQYIHIYQVIHSYVSRLGGGSHLESI